MAFLTGPAEVLFASGFAVLMSIITTGPIYSIAILLAYIRYKLKFLGSSAEFRSCINYCCLSHAVAMSMILTFTIITSAYESTRDKRIGALVFADAMPRAYLNEKLWWMLHGTIVSVGLVLIGSLIEKERRIGEQEKRTEQSGETNANNREWLC